MNYIIVMVQNYSVVYTRIPSYTIILDYCKGDYYYMVMDLWRSGLDGFRMHTYLWIDV